MVDDVPPRNDTPAVFIALCEVVKTLPEVATRLDRMADQMAAAGPEVLPVANSLKALAGKEPITPDQP